MNPINILSPKNCYKFELLQVDGRSVLKFVLKLGRNIWEIVFFLITKRDQKILKNVESSELNFFKKINNLL